MPFMTITCRCGHEDDIDRFTSTVFGDLPRGDYQCPACGFAWRLEHGRATVRPSGFVIPGKVTIREINPRL